MVRQSHPRTAFRRPRGGAIPEGVATHYTFDDNGNLTVLDHRLGASSVARYDYGYDRNGMRASMVDNNGLHDYTYDTLYQIIQATHPTVTNPTESFQYDAAGNRLLDESRAYSYNELNQLEYDGEYEYEYDLDGNMVLKVEKASGDTTVFHWNEANRLVKVEKPGTVAEYVYGPLGRRLAKTVNGTITQFRYDGQDLILELDDAGNVTGSWTFGTGVDDALAMNRGGVSYYYMTDAFGSVTALTDETGAVAQTYEYGVFGEITEQTGALDNPFAYTGREWEPEVGLYYYRFRFYDSRTGRFMNEDPIGYLAGQLVLYGYVSNNPVNYFDPFGLDEFRYAIYSKEDCKQAETFEKWFGQFLKEGDNLKVKYFTPEQYEKMIEFLKEGDKCAVGGHGLHPSQAEYGLNTDAIYSTGALGEISFEKLNSSADVANISIVVDACYAAKNLPPGQDVYQNISAAEGTEGLVDIGKAGMKAMGIPVPTKDQEKKGAE